MKEKGKKKKCRHNGHGHCVGGQFWHPEIFFLFSLLDFFLYIYLKVKGRRKERRKKKLFFVSVYIYVIFFTIASLVWRDER